MFSIDDAKEAVLIAVQVRSPKEAMPMKAKVIALVLASPFVLAAVGQAAPPATKYQSTLTDNTASNTATVHLLKASKIQIKVTSGNVCIALKMKGVGLKTD